MSNIDSGLTPVLNTEVASTPLAASSLLEIPSFTFRSSQQLRDLVTNLANDARQSSGTLEFANGIVSGTLTSPTGASQTSLNLVEQGTNFANSLATLNGTLNFANGVVNGSLNTPSGPLPVPQNFNFAQAAGSFVGLYFRQLNGTIPFNGGVINIENFATPLGTVAGTIGFANGQLSTNLITPFGNLQGSSAFGEDAKIPFSFNGLPGVVDFSTGQISADVLPGIPGGEVSIPFTSLAGTLTFNNGVASISVPSSLGNLATDFDFANFAVENVTRALQGNGTVTFTQGVTNIDVTGPLGTIQTSFDLPTIARNFATSLQNVQGTVTLANGTVNSNLTTPWGAVVGSANLDELLARVQPLLGGTPTT
jgi:hypothetical protein